MSESGGASTEGGGVDPAEEEEGEGSIAMASAEGGEEGTSECVEGDALSVEQACEPIDMSCVLGCTTGSSIIAADGTISSDPGMGGFPSVSCYDLLLAGGKWYFEMRLNSGGCMQVGWVDALFTGSADKGEGVGDDVHSWAFDGYRRYRWHRDSDSWGKKWRVGDVLGCAIDIDNRVSECFE